MGIMMFKLKQLLKPAPLLLFIVPLVASMVFGNFFEKQQQELVIPIGIVDEDQSDFSRKILKQMKSQKRIVVYEVSAEKAKGLLMRNEVDSVFFIKKAFQQKLLAEERAATIELWSSPTSVASGIVREVVASEVVKMSSAIKAANRVVELYKQKNYDEHFQKSIWYKSYEYANGQWDQGKIVTIEFVQRKAGGQSREDRNLEGQRKEVLISPYLRIWSFFTILFCLMTSDWILKERLVLFSRMMSTNVGLSSYLIQTSGANMVFHALQALFSFILLDYFQLIERSSHLLIGMLLFIAFITAIGFFVASRMHHLGSYYVTVILLGLIMAILGESFFPLVEFSPILECISNWLPQKILWQATYSIETPVNGLGKTALFMILATFLLWGWTIRGLGRK